MRENAGGLFQVRDITCGCGRRLRVPVLGDVYSLVREGIEAERREESELLLKFALDEIERLRAALHEAERAELVEPVAYRVECRWADPALDQTWSKYADYGTRKAAELSQQRFAGPGDIQSRIVPLYAGEPEEPR